jgi:hypothetical protein
MKIFSHCSAFRYRMNLSKLSETGLRFSPDKVIVL